MALENMIKFFKISLGVILIYAGIMLQYEILNKNQPIEPKFEPDLFQPKIYKLPYYQIKKEETVKFYDV
jgi:hypothetical protein